VLTFALVALFLAGAIWFLFATVPVYEVSHRARLEVNSAVHPVVPTVAGQVVETRLVIGREVQAGEVLVMLDARAAELAYRERLSQREALRTRLRAVQQDRLAQQGESRAQLTNLDSQVRELEGNLATEEAAIHRFQFDIEQRFIRAPVAGRIGEVGEVRVGSMVGPGDRLGSVVPPGQLWVVALFDPAVIGRIQRGQPARLRLVGFPWTQFGTIPATVSDVATEPTSGLIRVELTLAPSFSTTIPLTHGLQGSVEIEVERTSPAVLVLRAAGQFLGTQRSTAADGKERAEP
jgi:membrane fusion protein (multidrug efflux system)